MAQIAEIIKYEGDNGTFIWKHPQEDFNSLTQLIVHESQEAIFFMNGQALDSFEAGRYTLETQNIPKIGKFLNRAAGDKTPFHAEVYFVNKTEQMSLKWGTDSKVQYIEPTYGFPLSIGASGEMSLKVLNGRKLLLKLVGTESFLGQQKLVGFFRAFLMTRVKAYIAQVMKTNAVSIFEIDENLVSFSENIHKLLIPDFEDYGVSLERFFVTTIVKPDGDRQYEKFKELHFRQYADIAEAKLRQQTDLIYAQTEAQKIVIDSKAQDISKHGFMREPAGDIKKTEPLLKRAFLFLEDGNFKSADEYCEKVLDINPECAEAYLGKLMAELKVNKRSKLLDCELPFDTNSNYKKIMRFGDENLKTQLQKDIEFINEQNERTRKDDILKTAKMKVINQRYKEALNLLNEISGYKNADALVVFCNKKLKEKRLEAEQKAEERKIKIEKAAKKLKKIAPVAIPAICVCVAFLIVLNTVIIPKYKLNKAMSLLDSGEYDSAYALL